MPDFRPSDVVLEAHVFPLGNTLGKFECEIAAAVVIRSCHRHGDAWQPVTPSMMSTSLKKDLEESEYWQALLENPFVKFDFVGLVRRGFATGNIIEDSTAPITLTEKLFDAIKKYVR